MTYIELYNRANRMLDGNEITLGEYEEMIKPLNKNINYETAYWVKAKGMMPPEYFGHYYCSNCEGLAMRDWKKHKTVLSDYCPHCGYKMDVRERV